MGWTFGWNSRQELIKHLTDKTSHVGDDGNLHIFETLKHSARGNVLWVVTKNTSYTPQNELIKSSNTIVCVLLKGARSDGWGYKDMDESMGPFEYSCPLSYLKLVPEPNNSNSKGWRDKVRQYHATIKAKADTYLLFNDHLTFQNGVVSIAFRKNKSTGNEYTALVWSVIQNNVKEDTRTPYRIPPSRLSNAKRVSKEEAYEAVSNTTFHV